MCARQGLHQLNCIPGLEKAFSVSACLIIPSQPHSLLRDAVRAGLQMHSGPECGLSPNSTSTFMQENQVSGSGMRCFGAAAPIPVSVRASSLALLLSQPFAFTGVRVHLPGKWSCPACLACPGCRCFSAGHSQVHWQSLEICLSLACWHLTFNTILIRRLVCRSPVCKNSEEKDLV